MPPTCTSKVCSPKSSHLQMSVGEDGGGGMSFRSLAHAHGWVRNKVIFMREGKMVKSKNLI